MSRGELPQILFSHWSRAAANESRAKVSRPSAAFTARTDDYLREAQLLAALRLVLAGSLLAGVWLIGFRLQVELPVLPLLAAASAMALSAVCLIWRTQRGAQITANRLTAQLLVDIGVLTFALYWVGGATLNPFADVYVLFVCLAAIALPWRRVGVVLAAAVGAFTLLRWQYVPLDLEHAAISTEDLDSATHWVHFVMTGSLVALFGYRLADVARRARESAARSREQEARNDSAVSLASLAAGTAHEMGTPLTTMAVLVSEMRREAQMPSEWRQNLDVMWNAIQACKRSLGEMVAAVGADRIPEQECATVAGLVEQAVTRARALRAGARFAISIDGAGSSPHVHSGPTLRQALLNVLNNAAEVSPQNVEVRINWSTTDAYVDVLDRGPGISPELRARLGNVIVSTKDELHGNGLGVFLASMTVARLGGRIDFLPRFGGGTCARVRLPISTDCESKS